MTSSYDLGVIVLLSFVVSLLSRWGVSFVGIAASSYRAGVVACLDEDGPCPPSIRRHPAIEKTIQGTVSNQPVKHLCTRNESRAGGSLHSSSWSPGPYSPAPSHWLLKSSASWCTCLFGFDVVYFVDRYARNYCLIRFVHMYSPRVVQSLRYEREL